MSSEKYEKKTLNIRGGDWDYLTNIYQPKGVATSLIIRRLVSIHVDQIRAKETPDRELSE